MRRGDAGDAFSAFREKLGKSFQIKNILVVAVKIIYTVLILTEAQLLSCCEFILKFSHTKPSQSVYLKRNLTKLKYAIPVCRQSRQEVGGHGGGGCFKNPPSNL